MAFFLCAMPAFIIAYLGKFFFRSLKLQFRIQHRTSYPNGPSSETRPKASPKKPLWSAWESSSDPEISMERSVRFPADVP